MMSDETNESEEQREGEDPAGSEEWLLERVSRYRRETREDRQNPDAIAMIQARFDHIESVHSKGYSLKEIYEVLKEELGLEVTYRQFCRALQKKRKEEGIERGGATAPSRKQERGFRLPQRTAEERRRDIVG